MLSYHTSLVLFWCCFCYSLFLLLFSPLMELTPQLLQWLDLLLFSSSSSSWVCPPGALRSSLLEGKQLLSGSCIIHPEVDVAHHTVNEALYELQAMSQSALSNRSVGTQSPQSTSSQLWWGAAAEWWVWWRNETHAMLFLFNISGRQNQGPVLSHGLLSLTVG